MAVYPESSVLADLLQGTLPKFMKRKWQDLSQTLQYHTYTSRVAQGAQYGIDGGTDLRWRIQTSYADSFRDRGIGAIETAQAEYVLYDALVKWASSSVSRTWFTEEVDFNSASEETIINITAPRIHSMYLDLINGEESRLWGSPTSSTQDPRPPSGIPFWIQKASVGTSATAYGLNGGNPTGFSSGCADVDSTVVTNWKNGNGGYSQVSQSDLLPKLSEAIVKSYYQPPKSYASLQDAKPDYVLYTTWPVLNAMHNLQTTSNDNLGMDVGKFRDVVMFKGIPVTRVPALDVTSYASYDSTNPIYGMDWSNFKCFYKTGWDWQEQALETPNGQPTARKFYMICWRNYRVLDRRQMFVFHSTVFTG